MDYPSIVGRKPRGAVPIDHGDGLLHIVLGVDAWHRLRGKSTYEE